MRRTHPFLSPLGVGFTLLVFLGMGFSLWRDGGAMFSPGELTAQNSTGQVLNGVRSHAELERDCQYCHAPLQTTQADLCLRCHLTVFEQINTQSGTHGKLSNIQRCRACHPDHRGREYDPVAAAFTEFDHSLTRFSLRWHQVDYNATIMECTACHTSGNGFQVSSTACEDCHDQHPPGFVTQHRQDFGEDCLACHDGLDSMTQFDHTTTGFPLDGEHLSASCASCHREGIFAGTPSTCAACHEEPEVHRTLFSPDCQACHTTSDWLVVNLPGLGLYDHFSMTGFSLTRHLVDYSNSPLACTGCHTPADGLSLGFDLRFCVDCHTRQAPAFLEEHQAQFGRDCLACHDGVDRMDDFDHNRFFPLDGGHADIPCESCHLPQFYSGTPNRCADCHEEPEIHAGYFGLQCENCHLTSAWSPAQMVAHTFPLDHGGGDLVSCDTCHLSAYTQYTCYGCHEHQQGEILSEHAEEGITGARLENCVECHPTGREDENEKD